MKITLEKKALLLWRIRLTILLLPSAFLSGGLGFIFLPIAIFLLIATLIAYTVTFLFWLPEFLNSYSFYYKDGSLTVKIGIFTRKTAVLRRDRIQHTQVRCTPLQRILSLRTIVFYCAGSCLRVQNITVREMQILYKLSEVRR